MEAGDVSGGDGPAGTTTTAEIKGEVDRTTGQAVAEDSRQAEGNEGPTPPASRKLIKFTSKIKRGLGLVRIIVSSALLPDARLPELTVKTWTKVQQDEFNSALEWIEQEEVWNQELAEEARITQKDSQSA